MFKIFFEHLYVNNHIIRWMLIDSQLLRCNYKIFYTHNNIAITMYHSNGKSPDKAAVLILRLFSSYKSHT